MNLLSGLLLVLLSFVFPPGTALILDGCGTDFLISILLALLGVIPAVLHSLWLVWRRYQAQRRWGRGGYRYVGNGMYEGLPHATHPPNAQQPIAAQESRPPAYGSAGV
ncbi:hypothetical protein BKA62DRAFT_720794 [Auriculariales sp. MPI-PUGE-AT-0066]|nr:hypothetical protein BKA62DRAFT_720794 [Auriculariales sp. MPI-PUGE-AT-0066]